MVATKIKSSAVATICLVLMVMLLPIAGEAEIHISPNLVLSGKVIVDGFCPALYGIYIDDKYMGFESNGAWIDELPDNVGHYSKGTFPINISGVDISFVVGFNFVIPDSTGLKVKLIGLENNNCTKILARGEHGGPPKPFGMCGIDVHTNTDESVFKIDHIRIEKDEQILFSIGSDQVFIEYDWEGDGVYDAKQVFPRDEVIECTDMLSFGSEGEKEEKGFLLPLWLGIAIISVLLVALFVVVILVLRRRKQNRDIIATPTPVSLPRTE